MSLHSRNNEVRIVLYNVIIHGELCNTSTIQRLLRIFYDEFYNAYFAWCFGQDLAVNCNWDFVRSFSSIFIDTRRLVLYTLIEIRFEIVRDSSLFPEYTSTRRRAKLPCLNRNVSKKESNLGHILSTLVYIRLHYKKKKKKEETWNFLFKNIFSHLLLRQPRNNFTHTILIVWKVFIYRRRYLLDLLLQFSEMISVLEV